MASLELDPASKRYRVRFRFGGHEFKRSLRTKHRRVANGSLGQVEETLRLLELGMADIPLGVDEGDYIVSGARARKKKRETTPTPTLDKLFAVYEQELPAGSKEQGTLKGEKTHFTHLLRHLKAGTKTAALTKNAVQKYIESRSKDKHRGEFIGPDTIKKEITTLRLVWNWAKSQGYLSLPAPVDGLIYPKRDEKPPFMTMAEINRVLGRGKVNKQRENELWESLYLTRSEIDGVLDHASQQRREPFVFPMFVLAAHTGMRRSELIRSEATDFDFDGRTILVREKKRSRKHALSFRRVPMTALVERVFRSYFSEHPGGCWTLSRSSGQPLDRGAASRHFNAALKDSPWERVRGFHVLRHSFASNAAAEGIDQRMIDEWMGHQTDEMRRRYRHLAPHKQQEALDTVFSERSRQAG